MVRVILLFYFVMGLLGLGLIGWRVDETSAFNPFGTGGELWLPYLAVAAAAVAVLHAASVLAVRHWVSLARGVGEMRVWLGGLSRREVFAVALASGLGEEIFFRGWLLNEVGLFWSSVLFGLVHVPPSRNWLYWPFFACAMGFGLGALCLWTDSLLYAVLVHAGINFINILRLPRAAEDLPGGSERGFPGPPVS